MTETPRFTPENTEGYTAADLIALNAAYESAVYLPPDAVTKMGDMELGSWRDHTAEQVLADFDTVDA